MLQDLQESIIRILKGPIGPIVGTGFVVTDRLAVTCAHVVQAAGSNCGHPIQVQFLNGVSPQTAQVLNDGWSTQDDVAFLLLERFPAGIVPTILGTAEGRSGHSYTALGFSRLANYEVRWAYDKLGGVVPVENRHSMLQCEGSKIKRGMSGAPVLDLDINRVVGMISEYKDDERVRFAWATTTNTLVTLNPVLRLWPDIYGPHELNIYLDHLITTNEKLILSDGREVQLDRIYVSLRADEMNAVERQAEHDFYLEDVVALQNVIKGSVADQYAEFAAMRKVIARHPKMMMLEARDWARLFGEREHSLLSLAEVMERHRYVVILGDPGSGKTTLGKWLVLQYARALLRNEPHVQVPADLVQPGAETDKLIDLGPVRLPILIRIADYARVRWDKEQGDTELPLENYICQQHNTKTHLLPFELKPEVVSALIQEYLKQGRTLLILDGLDEVANPGQRRAVMRAVKKFIETQPPVSIKNKWSGNRILLTSRIVGYQFQPLTHLPHYTVEDMDEPAIAAFCHAWMTHIAEIQDVAVDVQAVRLKVAIFDHAHPGLQPLAGNPYY